MVTHSQDSTKVVQKVKNPRIPAHLWVALSNWTSKAGSVAAQLVCLPLLSTLLTPAEFAAYAIAASLMTWYQLCDFGFGNSVQNHIAQAQARNDEVGHYIAAVGLLGAGLFLAGIIILVSLSPWLARLLFGRLALSPELRPDFILWIGGVFLLGNMLGMIAQKMLYALQKGIYANLLGLLNSLAFLTLLWMMARHVAPPYRLLASVSAYTGPMGVSGIMTLTYLAARYGRWTKAGIKAHYRTLRAPALRFWLFALLAASVLNVDYLVMSRTLSADDIAAYNVLFRVFWVGMSLYSGLLTATWPVFTKMGVHGDRPGMNRYIRRYLLSGLGALTVLSAIMAVALPQALRWLAPGLSIQVSVLTLGLFSFYIGVRIWTDTYAVALQALNEVGVFLKVVPVQAVISFPAQLVLALRLGIDGILLGLILSFVLTVVWVLPWRLKTYWIDASPKLTITA